MAYVRDESWHTALSQEIIDDEDEETEAEPEAATQHTVTFLDTSQRARNHATVPYPSALNIHYNGASLVVPTAQQQQQSLLSRGGGWLTSAARYESHDKNVNNRSSSNTFIGSNDTYHSTRQTTTNNYINNTYIRDAGARPEASAAQRIADNPHSSASAGQRSTNNHHAPIPQPVLLHIVRTAGAYLVRTLARFLARLGLGLVSSAWWYLAAAATTALALAAAYALLVLVTARVLHALAASWGWMTSWPGRRLAAAAWSVSGSDSAAAAATAGGEAAQSIATRGWGVEAWSPVAWIAWWWAGAGTGTADGGGVLPTFVGDTPPAGDGSGSGRREQARRSSDGSRGPPPELSIPESVAPIYVGNPLLWNQAFIGSVEQVTDRLDKVMELVADGGAWAAGNEEGRRPLRDGDNDHGIVRNPAEQPLRAAGAAHKTTPRTTWSRAGTHPSASRTAQLVRLLRPIAAQLYEEIRGVKATALAAETFQLRAGRQIAGEKTAADRLLAGMRARGNATGALLAMQVANVKHQQQLEHQHQQRRRKRRGERRRWTDLVHWGRRLGCHCFGGLVPWSCDPGTTSDGAHHDDDDGGFAATTGHPGDSEQVRDVLLPVHLVLQDWMMQQKTLYLAAEQSRAGWIKTLSRTLPVDKITRAVGEPICDIAKKTSGWDARMADKADGRGGGGGGRDLDRAAAAGADGDEERREHRVGALLGDISKWAGIACSMRQGIERHAEQRQARAARERVLLSEMVVRTAAELDELAGKHGAVWGTEALLRRARSAASAGASGVSTAAVPMHDGGDRDVVFGRLDDGDRGSFGSGDDDDGGEDDDTGVKYRSVGTLLARDDIDHVKGSIVERLLKWRRLVGAAYAEEDAQSSIHASE